MLAKDLNIGAHTSASGGAYNAILNAAAIKANICQLFTSSPRQWRPKVLSLQEIQSWEEARIACKMQPHIMSHASYLINLGSTNSKNIPAFLAEIRRCHALHINYLTFHPGTAGTDTVQNCLDRISANINKTKELTAQGETRLLIETTAGQGTTVGNKFEHLGYIIKHVDPAIRLGVCLDTCHVFAAGYDIRTLAAWENVLAEFEAKIGLQYLFAFHLNDSKHTLGSRRDRHAALGEGYIGKEAFANIVNDMRTAHLPLYLETPDPKNYAAEIALLRSMRRP